MFTAGAAMLIKSSPDQLDIPSPSEITPRTIFARVFAP